MNEKEFRDEWSKSTKKQLIDRIWHGHREITSWRQYFLDELFRLAKESIPEEDKTRLTGYFLYMPPDSFRDPWTSWNECVSALLYYKERK